MAALGVAALGTAAVATMMSADADDLAVSADQTSFHGARQAESTRTRPACEPVGCEVWRVEVPSEHPVLVSDEVVVSLGHDDVVGYDTNDGRRLWRIDAPDDINPNAVALSEHGLAMTITGPDTGNTVVAVHDPMNGTRLFEVPLAAGNGARRTQVAWMDGHLIVVASPRGGSQHEDDATTTSSVRAFSSDGQEVWSRNTSGVPLVLADPPAILSLESGVTRIDPVLGDDRWTVQAPLAALSVDGDELLTVEAASGTVEVVDFAAGATSRSMTVEGAQSAFFLGPWVAIDVGDELRLHDRVDGDELFRRPTNGHANGDADVDAQRPGPRPSAVAVGDRVAVMGLDSDGAGVELTTYTAGGTFEASVELPFEEHPVHPVLLESDDDVVHVASRGGPGDGLVVTVDLASQRVLDVADGRWALRRDGLLLVGVDQGVRLIGANGEMLARHAPHVASTEPLVVHGAGGIMRLDADRLRQQAR